MFEDGGREPAAVHATYVNAVLPGLGPIPNSRERLVRGIPAATYYSFACRWLWDEAERFIAESLARQPSDAARVCANDADAFAAIHWCASAPRQWGGEPGTNPIPSCLFLSSRTPHPPPTPALQRHLE